MSGSSVAAVSCADLGQPLFMWIGRGPAGRILSFLRPRNFRALSVLGVFQKCPFLISGKFCKSQKLAYRKNGPFQKQGLFIFGLFCPGAVPAACSFRAVLKNARPRFALAFGPLVAGMGCKTPSSARAHFRKIVKMWSIGESCVSKFGLYANHEKRRFELSVLRGRILR